MIGETKQYLQNKSTLFWRCVLFSPVKHGIPAIPSNVHS
jgi:hypothetical protein